MGAVELVEEAVQDAQEDFLARQRDAAEADPQWAPLAKHMGAWEDEDGNFAHGVQGDDQAVIQAGRLEYGDVEHPPSALIRMGVLTQVSNIKARLDSHFRRGGY